MTADIILNQDSVSVVSTAGGSGSSSDHNFLIRGGQGEGPGEVHHRFDMGLHAAGGNGSVGGSAQFDEGEPRVYLYGNGQNDHALDTDPLRIEGDGGSATLTLGGAGEMGCLKIHDEQGNTKFTLGCGSGGLTGSPEGGWTFGGSEQNRNSISIQDENKASQITLNADNALVKIGAGSGKAGKLQVMDIPLPRGGGVDPSVTINGDSRSDIITVDSEVQGKTIINDDDIELSDGGTAQTELGSIGIESDQTNGPTTRLINKPTPLLEINDNDYTAKLQGGSTGLLPKLYLEYSGSGLSRNASLSAKSGRFFIGGSHSVTSIQNFQPKSSIGVAEGGSYMRAWSEGIDFFDQFPNQAGATPLFRFEANSNNPNQLQFDSGSFNFSDTISYDKPSETLIVDKPSGVSLNPLLEADLSSGPNNSRTLTIGKNSIINSNAPDGYSDAFSYDEGTGKVTIGELEVKVQFTQPSDRRLKEGIEDLDAGLEEAESLRPVSYAWTENGDERHLGLIAQEVEDVLPEVVDRPEDGHLGMDYTQLVPLLVNAAQEEAAEREALAEEVEDQRETIEAQRETIEELETRIERLEEAAS